MATYHMRLSETCQDREYDSDFTVTLPVTTRPIKAQLPPMLKCHDFTDYNFIGTWSGGVPENCTFVGWEVGLRLLPRLPFVNYRGVYEEAAPEGDWDVACLMNGRDDTTCTIGPYLLSNRDYRIRVRELCTDPQANSVHASTVVCAPPWRWIDGACFQLFGEAVPGQTRNGLLRIRHHEHKCIAISNGHAGYPSLGSALSVQHCDETTAFDFLVPEFGDIPFSGEGHIKPNTYQDLCLGSSAGRPLTFWASNATAGMDYDDWMNTINNMVYEEGMDIEVFECTHKAVLEFVLPADADGPIRLRHHPHLCISAAGPDAGEAIEIMGCENTTLGAFLVVPMNPTRKNFLDAERACTLLGVGAHLARVDNLDQSNGLFDMTGGYGDVWIGMRSTSRRRQHFATWQDGEPSLYDNTSPQATLTSTTDCKYIGSDGTWLNADCFDTARRYICRMEIPDSPCRTDAIPAFNVTNVETYEVRLYDFEVRWQANDYRACIFKGWEVQALAFDYEWPADDYLALDFVSPVLTGRAQLQISWYNAIVCKPGYIPIYNPSLCHSAAKILGSQIDHFIYRDNHPAGCLQFNNGTIMYNTLGEGEVGETARKAALICIQEEVAYRPGGEPPWIAPTSTTTTATTTTVTTTTTTGALTSTVTTTSTTSTTTTSTSSTSSTATTTTTTSWGEPAVVDMVRLQHHLAQCMSVNMGLPEDGNNVQVWQCKSGSAYDFIVPADGSGPIQMYENTTYCLGSTSVAAGSNVEVWECSSVNALTFNVPTSGEGQLELTDHAGLCLTASTVEDGANIEIQACGSSMGFFVKKLLPALAYGDARFFVDKALYSFEQAGEACSSLGMSLASIRSLQEQEDARELLSQINLDRAWIGGQMFEDFDGVGFTWLWKWTDGAPWGWGSTIMPNPFIGGTSLDNRVTLANEDYNGPFIFQVTSFEELFPAVCCQRPAATTTTSTTSSATTTTTSTTTTSTTSVTTTTTTSTATTTTSNTTFTTTTSTTTRIYGCLLDRRDQTSCLVGVGIGSNVTYKVRVRETCTDPIYNSNWSYLPDPLVTTRPPVQADMPIALRYRNTWPYLLMLEWDLGSGGECEFVAWGVELRLLPPYGAEGSDQEWEEQLECRALPRSARGCNLTAAWTPGGDATLLYDRDYELRVTETCTDKNAFSPPAILTVRTRAMMNAAIPTNLVHWWPIRADWPTRADSWSVHLRWTPGHQYDCYFREWEVFLTPRNISNTTNMTEWQEPPIGCRDLTIRVGWFLVGEEPTYAARCTPEKIISGIDYDVRVQERCTWVVTSAPGQIVVNLDSPIGYFSATSAPAPATRPPTTRTYDATETSIMLQFLASTPGDCPDAEPFVQIAAKGESWWTTKPFNCSYAEDLSQGVCRIWKLLPDTLYYSQIRINCPSFPTEPEFHNIYSNFTLVPEPIPTLPGCKWLYDSGSEDEYKCLDETLCNSTSDEACCNNYGGIELCPARTPVMCALAGACANGQDHCCEYETFEGDGCGAVGGPRMCSAAYWPAKPPAIASASSKNSAAILLAWEIGVYLAPVRSACTFANWHIQYRKQCVQLVLGSDDYNCDDQGMNCEINDIERITVLSEEETELAFQKPPGVVDGDRIQLRGNLECQLKTELCSTQLLDFIDSWLEVVLTPDPLILRVKKGFPAPVPLIIVQLKGATAENGYVGRREQWDLTCRDLPDNETDTWHDVTNCGNMTNRSHTQCEIKHLVSLQRYDVRLSEVCTDALLSSFYTMTRRPVVTKGYLPRVPLNVTVELISATAARLSWGLGPPGDCVFAAFQVEMAPGFPMDLASSWYDVPSCNSVPTRDINTCVIPGISTNTPYYLRIKETCANPRTNGHFYTTPVFRFLEVGVWEVYLGFSLAGSTVSTDSLLSPHSCVVQKQCCEDEHSMCYGEPRRQLMTVTRTDQPLGWGQKLWLRCITEAVATAQGGVPVVQAEAPLQLQLFDPGRHVMEGTWSIGTEVGTCECARPQLQLIPKGPFPGGLGGYPLPEDFSLSSWIDFGGACADPLERTCSMPGLEVDTEYFARMRVLCLNDETTSNWTDGFAPIVTEPGCRWSVHSGFHGMFECADGAFCETSNETCCSDRGGRQRCPKEAPVMCSTFTCAEATERCCVEHFSQCTPHGGRRPCHDHEVPAKPPAYVTLSMATPHTLMLTWTPGSYLSPKRSLCRFRGLWSWDIQLRASGTRSPTGAWNASEDTIEEWSRELVRHCIEQERETTYCLVPQLNSLTAYEVRIRELCGPLDDHLDSFWAWTGNNGTTLAIPADPPTDVMLKSMGADWLEVSWVPARYIGDCHYVNWELMWRHWSAGLADDAGWMDVSHVCSAGRLDPRCNVTDIPAGRTLQLRVREQCFDPDADSPYAFSAPIRWDGPEEWDVYIGSSPSTRKTVSVLAIPDRCHPLKDACCQSDDFALCHTTMEGRDTVVTRTDYLPAAQKGWTQHLWVRCFSAGHSLPPRAPSRDPSFFELTLGPSRDTMRARFAIGDPGDCLCAQLQLRFKEEGPDGWTEWRNATEDCIDFGNSDCVLPGLRVNTKFDGELKVTCSDDGLSSMWVPAIQPFITAPGCHFSRPPSRWSPGLGQEDQIMCHDGYVCPAAANATCCRERDSTIARCPESTPIMCAEASACAGQQDRCCVAEPEDCGPHGGERFCGIRVPAATPDLVDVQSLDAASLTIRWSAGEYLNGNAKCSFLKWEVELAEVFEDGTLGDWAPQPACGLLEKSRPEVTTTCELSGLGGLVSYLVRIWETCTERDLDSLPAMISSPVVTLPRQALPPMQISCLDNSADASGTKLHLQWDANDPRECNFTSWHVEAKLLPSVAARGPTGLDEPALDGGSDWFEVCSVGPDREDVASCTAEHLLSGRFYDIRVRELCTSWRANSDWGMLQLSDGCEVNAVPALPPEDLQALAAEEYNFTVHWNGGDPKACIFAEWEVQAWISTTTTSPGPPTFAPTAEPTPAPTEAPTALPTPAPTPIPTGPLDGVWDIPIYGDFPAVIRGLQLTWQGQTFQISNLNTTSETLDISGSYGGGSATFTATHIYWANGVVYGKLSGDPSQYLSTYTTTTASTTSMTSATSTTSTTTTTLGCKILRGSCPDDGWTVGPGDTCYSLASASSRFSDCASHCAPGNVAVVKNAEENEAIVQLISGVSDGPVWITYNASLPFRNFAVGEPTFGAGVACLVMRHAGGEQGEWDDKQCYSSYQCLCEVPKVSRSLTSCVVTVGLGSATDYTVRARERCTDRQFDSAWAYAAVTTAPPARAEMPQHARVEWQSPFTFDIKWQAGDPGLCDFVDWHVELRSVDSYNASNATSEWRKLEDCLGLRRHAGKCELTTRILDSSWGMRYDLRITETCTDENAWSQTVTLASAIVLSQAVALPTNLRVIGLGHEWMLLEWRPGSIENCSALGWSVQYHEDSVTNPDDQFGVQVPCSSSTCNITGLETNKGYWFRVVEACKTSYSVRSELYSPVPFSTLPGEWETFIGPSTGMNITLFVAQEPLHCVAVKECCPDQFSICYNSQDRRQVTVTRTDIPGGWGQNIKLRCSMKAMEAFTEAPSTVADPPDQFYVKDPTNESANVVLPERLGLNMRDCECAYPRLEHRTDAAGNTWQLARSTCTNFWERNCVVRGLQPRVTYKFRLRTGCRDDRLSSNYSDAFFPLTTIVPIRVVVGGIGGGVVQTGRRLAIKESPPTSSELVAAATASISALTSIPASDMLVDVPKLDDTSFYVKYEIAVDEADEASNVDPSVAKADSVISQLNARTFSASFAKNFDDADTLQVVAGPAYMAVRTESYASCGYPPSVKYAASSWDESKCATHSWSSGPCEVPCAEGYWRQGEMRCTAAGKWQSTLQCVPHWTASEWGECDNRCGPGLQHRSLVCPGHGCVPGKEEPELSQECFGTSGCAWTATTSWGACSTACGAGYKTRTVVCSSPRSEGDCLSDRPANRTDCFERSDCEWQTTDWGPCSFSCGTGTQSRDVYCPTGNPADCGAEVPSSLQYCRDTSGCQWYTAAWTPCSTACGAGTRSREVRCWSGVESECLEEKPVSSESCYEKEGCAWALGEWSPCSTSCGSGSQGRSVACPSGNNSDCPGEAPVSQRQCYDRAGCEWRVGGWTPCSTQCGAGLRSREVTCPSGVQADCGQEQPAANEACSDRSGCSWQVGDWGACSSSCGEGIRLRDVQCASGDAADCIEAEPARSETCLETSGCEWRMTQWSECSNSCGAGEKTRTVSCSSLSDESHCPGARPEGTQACSETYGCGWQLGAWSACNSTCGAGRQERTAQCLNAGGADCSEPGPATVQNCYATSSCEWQESAWSECSSGCGPGVSTREVRCSSGSDGDCSEQKPVTMALCYGRDSCEWDVEEWSACSAECGEGSRTRSVSCPSGNAQDCGAIAPPQMEQCKDISGCLWLLDDWSDCSSTCGEGAQNRDVVCSSADDADCVQAKPDAEKSCHSTAGCLWSMGAWLPCSTTCGYGEQTRSVDCPTGTEADCQGAKPASKQECHATAGCQWTVGEWGVCSTTCTPGSALRSVSCSSGEEADCSGIQRPMDRQSCGAGDGRCEWSIGDWGECSASGCGVVGLRLREVICPSTAGPSDCAGTPEDHTGACVYWGERCIDGGSDDDAAGDEGEKTGSWVVEDWQACSSECGDGIQQRTVSCSEGEDGCDLATRPADWQPCHGTSGCYWMVAPWSLCSVNCGAGTRQRSVTCSSGLEDDCESSTKVNLVEPCYQAMGCAWRTTEWSACSALCGEGNQSREVFCDSMSEADCGPDRPPANRSCQSSAGCAWDVTPWSACSTMCGAGLQRRNATCAANASNEDASSACSSPGPALWQPCTKYSGCSWETSAWSDCSVGCGTGTRTRQVQCSGEQAQARCEGDRPSEVESCRQTTSCVWLPGAWSPCGADCSPQTREVRCSGSKGDCSAQAPASLRPCNSSACAAASAGSGDAPAVADLRFELRLMVADPTVLTEESPQRRDALLAAARRAVADTLLVPKERVEVRLSSTRRLAAGSSAEDSPTLVIEVKVRGASAGVQALLSSDSIGAVLSQGLRGELERSRLAVLVSEVVFDGSQDDDVQTAPPSQVAEADTKATVATRASDAAQTPAVSGLLMAVLLMVSAIAATITWILFGAKIVKALRTLAYAFKRKTGGGTPTTVAGVPKGINNSSKRSKVASNPTSPAGDAADWQERQFEALSPTSAGTVPRSAWQPVHEDNSPSTAPPQSMPMAVAVPADAPLLGPSPSAGSSPIRPSDRFRAGRTPGSRSKLLEGLSLGTAAPTPTSALRSAASRRSLPDDAAPMEETPLPSSPVRPFHGVGEQLAAMAEGTDSASPLPQQQQSVAKGVVEIPELRDGGAISASALRRLAQLHEGMPGGIGTPNRPTPARSRASPTPRSEDLTSRRGSSSGTGRKGLHVLAEPPGDMQASGSRRGSSPRRGHQTDVALKMQQSRRAREEPPERSAWQPSESEGWLPCGSWRDKAAARRAVRPPKTRFFNELKLLRYSTSLTFGRCPTAHLLRGHRERGDLEADRTPTRIAKRPQVRARYLNEYLP
eukprot:TRINITY_DN750_c0_g2_i1.p1 TRINITY_DN750_c0_g2~~TRINITY_DN750_c0_g2_i1.p1  ORF type:complete len:5718 (-),score=836.45 TRINITY_DN750_c0_g2_i1:11-16636(-)